MSTFKSRFKIYFKKAKAEPIDQRRCLRARACDSEMVAAYGLCTLRDAPRRHACDVSRRLRLWPRRVVQVAFLEADVLSIRCQRQDEGVSGSCGRVGPNKVRLLGTPGEPAWRCSPRFPDGHSRCSNNPLGCSSIRGVWRCVFDKNFVTPTESGVWQA